jgi:hypothetical protein
MSMCDMSMSMSMSMSMHIWQRSISITEGGMHGLCL